MGICSSCLGYGRRSSDEAENPETSRLLHDNPYRSQYGTNVHQQQQRTVYAPDPEALRREREAMERICHAMTDEVVDVFTVLPPSTETPQPQSKDGPPWKREVSNPEEMAYKSIRRSRAGPISSAVKKDEPNWKAAKSIMG